MEDAHQHTLSPGMTWLLAVAVGVVVANLYYAQPLVGPIAAATGLAPGAAGLIVTLTQVGYCLGLLFIVPLGDMLENRRLAITLLLANACALAVAALSANPLSFLLAALAIGLTSVTTQVLVPIAAHLSAPERRGQTVGTVMSGLLLGIMLSRPIASLVADAFGWHAIFGLSATLTVGLACVLRWRLPRRQPQAAMPYPQLLASLLHLLRTTPILRRRAAYQFCIFGAFSLFWTTVPLYLASPAFGLSQTGIAIFALVGVAGALASPFAGRRADQGLSRSTTGMAIGAVMLAFAAPLLLHGGRQFELGLLVLAAVVLDMGVAANLVLGQRALFALGAELRARLNALYIAIFFLGGALGSALGGWTYAHHGWSGVLVAGLLLPAIALAFYLTEYADQRVAA